MLILEHSFVKVLEQMSMINFNFMNYFLSTMAEGFVPSHAPLKNNKHRNIPFQSTQPKRVSRECMFLHSLSHHNKDLERWTLKPSVRHSSRVLANRVIALRQVSVTALFYLEDSRRIHP